MQRVGVSKVIVRLGCLLLIGLGPLACGRDAETPATTGDASMEAPEALELTEPEAMEAPAAVTMPGEGVGEDVTAFIPAYPGAAEVREIKVTDAGGYGLYTSPDSPDAILAYYKERLPEDGWDVVGDVVREGEWAIAADRQGYQANVVITEEEGQSQIEVMVAAPF